MNTTALLLVSAGILATGFSTVAQETKPSTNAPARRPQSPPVVSPEILPNGDVTFRCRAAQAKEVKAAGQFGSDAKMTRDEQGVWSVTVPAVAPGVYEYRFVVDGLGVIDSQNPAIKPVEKFLLLTSPSQMAVRKGETRLQEALNTALVAMKADGGLNGLAVKWLKQPLVEGF